MPRELANKRCRLFTPCHRLRLSPEDRETSLSLFLSLPLSFSSQTLNLRSLRLSPFSFSKSSPILSVEHFSPKSILLFLLLLFFIPSSFLPIVLKHLRTFLDVISRRFVFSSCSFTHIATDRSIVPVGLSSAAICPPFVSALALVAPTLSPARLLADVPFVPTPLRCRAPRAALYHL